MKKCLLLILGVLLSLLSCNKVDGPHSVDLATLSVDYTARDGETLAGILGGNYKIAVADGATVTLRSAVIYGANEPEFEWAGITLLGDATLVLEGTNIVKGFYEEFPGIFVPEGKTLRIKGNGKLDVSSGGEAPGIGGDGESDQCGNVEILGGTIRATGGSYSAAIGSGPDKRCGDISISGGTVTAEGGYKSAGIGTSQKGSVGNITITSDVTQVKAVKWDEDTPHSIGGGVDYVSIGTVTVGGKLGPVIESPFVYNVR